MQMKMSKCNPFQMHLFALKAYFYGRVIKQTIKIENKIVVH